MEWIKNLNYSMINNTNFNGETNPENCGFGKWYYSFETSDPELQKHLLAWEEPHSQLHTGAESIITALKSRNKSRAISIYNTRILPNLNNLEKVKDSTISYLNSLNNENEKAFEIFQSQTMNSLATTQNKLGNLVSYFENNANNAQLTMESNITQMIYILSIATIISLIIGTSLSFLIIKSVHNHLGDDPGVIANIANQVSKGNLHLDIESNGKKTIGVYKSVIEMVYSLKYKAGILEKIAYGDL